MLVDADDGQMIAPGDLSGFFKIFPADRKFGMVASGDDFITVPGADSGINTDGHTVIRESFAKGFQLGKRIDRQEDPLIDGIAHLIQRDIIRNEKDVLRQKSGFFFHVDLAGAHGIDRKAFLFGDF